MRSNSWMARAGAGILLAGIILGAGCATTNKDAPLLDSGYAALEQRNFDQALTAADQYLQRHPSGLGAAEALYLRGRAVEQRIKPDEAATRADLQEARACYSRALTLSPNRGTEAIIRASLGNVAYFQEDFATAEQQWHLAYQQAQKPEDRSWALYRMGLCRQRLGRWSEADECFAQVRQQFPGTIPAQRAAEKQGMTAFFVQVASFQSAPSADTLAASLRSRGVVSVVQAKRGGGAAVMAGPYATYAQAAEVRRSLRGEFPDALVLP